VLFAPNAAGVSLFDSNSGSIDKSGVMKLYVP
jgi:hypothetical protein